MNKIYCKICGKKVKNKEKCTVTDCENSGKNSVLIFKDFKIDQPKIIEMYECEHTYDSTTDFPNGYCGY